MKRLTRTFAHLMQQSQLIGGRLEAIGINSREDPIAVRHGDNRSNDD
jgi:hypothetical protein